MQSSKTVASRNPLDNRRVTLARPIKVALYLAMSKAPTDAGQAGEADLGNAAAVVDGAERRLKALDVVYKAWIGLLNSADWRAAGRAEAAPLVSVTAAWACMVLSGVAIVLWIWVSADLPGADMLEKPAHRQGGCATIHGKSVPIPWRWLRPCRVWAWPGG